jgi:hypothetical protein
MSIQVSDSQIRNEFDLYSTNFLYGNAGDRTTHQIDLEISTYALASIDFPITFAPTDGYIENDHVISELDIFAEFEVGDTIMVTYAGGGNNGAHTITHKISDSDIRISGIGTTNTHTGTLIVNTTPIKAIELYYNFVENDIENDFISAIDGSVCKYSAPLKLSTDTSTTAMIPSAPMGWDIATNISITGNGIGTGTSGNEYISRYTISITTFITPFMLANQTKPPIYFKNSKCLKNIYKLKAFYDYQNPNRVIEDVFDTALGNTGWFGENLNSGISNYSTSNLIFKRADNTVIPSLELNTTLQQFQFDLDSITPTFSGTGSVVQVGMFKVCGDESEYRGTTNRLRENFVFDWLKSTTTILTPPAITGAFGILKNVTINYVNPNKVQIIGNIQFQNYQLNIYKLSDVPTFSLYCGTQNKLLITPYTDRENSLVCEQEFYTDNTDPNLLVTTIKFLKHYENNTDTEGSATINTFPEDEVVARTLFYIDKLGRSADAIKINTIGCNIIAKNSVTLEQFNLETYQYNISGASVVNGNQFTDMKINTPLQIPTGEIRKYIGIKRRVDLDTVDRFYYEFTYPFLMRWEYFKELQGVNGVFFDSAEPFNGFNNFWHRYTTEPNWNIYFEFESFVNKNGNVLKYNSESAIVTNDWDSNTNFVTNDIRTYDIDTNVQLVSGIQGFIQGYKTTKVIAQFNKVVGAVDLPNTVAVIRIEPFEQGGRDISQRISSSNVRGGYEILIDSNSIGTTSLYSSGQTIYAECLIDNDKLPNNTQFKISSRVYEKLLSSSKNFEFGDPFNFEFGDPYQFEFQ